MAVAVALGSLLVSGCVATAMWLVGSAFGASKEEKQGASVFAAALALIGGFVVTVTAFVLLCEPGCLN